MISSLRPSLFSRWMRPSSAHHLLNRFRTPIMRYSPSPRITSLNCQPASSSFILSHSVQYPSFRLIFQQPHRHFHYTRQLSTDNLPKEPHISPPSTSSNSSETSLSNQKKGVDRDARDNNSAAPQPFTPPSATFGGPGGLLFPPITKNPAIDAALTTIIGLLMVFFAGVAYLSWYKARVLDKIEQAFSEGYDPVLELANRSKRRVGGFADEDSEHLHRDEQARIDSIIKGREAGHYFLIMGSKGCGKTSMIFDAMQAINADGFAFCDAHEDLEVFRHRFGRAINFEYHEDSQTGLFQRRDPREGGPALDIERALAKLEKVALRMSAKKGRPLVLCINNIHLFGNNDESRKLLLQLQQKAESWAQCGILTLVLSTDDFWPYPVLWKNASRMHIISIGDLPEQTRLPALQAMRKGILGSRYPETQPEIEPSEVLNRVLSITGGRLSFLNRVARAREDDMQGTAERMLQREKAYILSQIGLIADCDDDVMDEQKWASCSWLLLREFVKRHKDAERERSEKISAGASPEEFEELPMPSIPYWQCRQIMTRTDFIEGLDYKNIIAIDVNYEVRPDSAMVLQAAREVVEEEGFDDLLDSVRARVDEIESLHRTRELTFKDIGEGDRIRVEVDKGGRGFSFWRN